MSENCAASRIKRLQSEFDRVAQQGFDVAKIDAFFVAREDAFNGEEVRPCDERLAWLTGFTGSAGFAIITKEKAALFVDGRYTIQAKEQVQGQGISVHDYSYACLLDWLLENYDQTSGQMTSGQMTIGFDGRTLSQAVLQKLLAITSHKQASIAWTSDQSELLDKLWAADQVSPRPPQKFENLRDFPLEYAGQTAAQKCQSITAMMRKQGLSAYFISDPFDLAWLTNKRGFDLKHSPIALMRALLLADGRLILFSAAPNISDYYPLMSDDDPLHCAPLPDVQDQETLICAYVPLNQIERKLEPILKYFVDGGAVGYDPSTTPVFLARLFDVMQGSALSSMIAEAKACKNASELNGVRQAHYLDALIMVRFLYWLEQQPCGAIDEISAAAKLDGMRLAHSECLALSFPTLSAFGANAALPHYRVDDKSNLSITQGLYLVDSGGQYVSGTTDITQTRLRGTPANLAELKKAYTLVLKGHLALARARFARGTVGQALDTIARMALWAQGMDFSHGTGHGVGAGLSVHEGPQRIGKFPAGVSTKAIALQEGMIVSNEPGYYQQGAFGIRIETLLVVRQDPEYAQFLSFEVLTLSPYDRALIDLALLSSEEREQINSYHQQVFQALEGGLESSERAWLKQACAQL